ncbi:QRFP-like peptide receptor [Oculina patagonica]
MNDTTPYYNGSKNSSKNDLLSTNDIVTFSAIVKLLMCAIVAVVSLVGNTIVIFVVFTTKKMQTNIYLFIVNMSVSDLLYTVIAIPPLVTGILGHPFSIRGHLGTFICKFINGMAFGLIASSVLTLAAISCDRFFAIVFPLRKLKAQAYLKWSIASIWICSALVISPMLYAMRLYEDDNSSYCYEDWSPYFDSNKASQTYSVVLFIVIYLIPFITMLILYSLISHFLWFRKIPGNGNETTRRRVMTSRRKVIRMLITIVLCFILCWLPLQIVTFSVFFGNIELPLEFFFVSEFLIRANGAVNPVIYAVFNENFRSGFKRFLCCTAPSNNHSAVTGNALSVTSSKHSNYVSGRRKLLQKESEL